MSPTYIKDRLDKVVYRANEAIDGLIHIYQDQYKDPDYPGLTLLVLHNHLCNCGYYHNHICK
jgi:formylmethanofuran dehydrogenase subunit E-like metal-binding protein